MDQNLRAVLYLRVSTEAQADKGLSLPAQLAACELKARVLGATVVSVYTDAGVSGAKFQTREGIQRALEDIESGKATLIIALDLSRVSRDREHQSHIKSRVEAAGGRLVFTEQSFDDTVEGEFMFNISGDVAAYYRSLFRKKSMEGKRNRANQNRQPCTGRRPLGYYIRRRSDAAAGNCTPEEVGTYQVIEEEAEVVREIFKRYAAGATLYELCAYLMRSGVHTAVGNEVWRNKSVRQLLMNTTYTGNAAFGKTSLRHAPEGLGRKWILRQVDQSEWIMVDAPAIIEQSLFDAVQARLDTAREKYSGRSDRKYVLSGLVICPDCGHHLCTSLNSGNKRPYVRCQYARRHMEPPNKPCTYKRMHCVVQLEKLVTRGMQTLVSRPEIAQHAIRAYRETQGEDDTETQIRQLQETMRQLGRREEAIVKLQIDAVVSGVDTAVYAGTLLSIAKEKAVGKERLKVLSVRRRQITDENQVDIPSLLTAAAADVLTVLTTDHLTGAEKNKVLSRVVDHIDLHDDATAITLVLRQSLPSSAGVTVPLISDKSC